MQSANKKERVAKRIAALGYCSRREAEKIIAQGLVKVNNQVINTPVTLVSAADIISINGIILKAQNKDLLLAYYKPKGLICSHQDERGRKTIFDDIYNKYSYLPRLIYVGRLDLNSEGLLLLTNNGDLAHKLTHPKHDFTRKYKVRAFGEVTQQQLDTLAYGCKINQITYKPIIANIIKKQKSNIWIDFELKEGKNREIRKVCEHLNLSVNRLIRISFGPYDCQDLQPSEIKELDIVPAKL